ncbi:FBP domain-containing protein [Paeniglutamicibacter sp.]|uniref:FBP domain-containing protein n=1 Tax=Paeniglutamicibacter sp. TaxID=1934391 RepID=UPI003989F2BD
MLSLSEKQIRSSFINASLRERKAITLPENFDALNWDDLDFLGWRDSKLPLVGYVVTVLDDAPVGIMFRKTEGKIRKRPQCSWCEDVDLPNDVVFFNAKQGGQAGRDGDTIGILVCAEFECPANVRMMKSLPYIGFDREAEIRRRITVLREHVLNFARRVREDG